MKPKVYWDGHEWCVEMPGHPHLTDRHPEWKFALAKANYYAGLLGRVELKIPSPKEWESAMPDISDHVWQPLSPHTARAEETRQKVGPVLASQLRMAGLGKWGL